jgi:putative ubiquitin-RnfH superfamily antitoxin RatB of RatAB toxin-antitoxin module
VTHQNDQPGIRIEVVLAMPERQALVSLEVTVGSTLADAIEQSGLPDSFEGFELNAAEVGIFGRKTSMEQVLRDGDRVEIYRPLIIDPKEMRRQLAQKQAKGVAK